MKLSNVNGAKDGRKVNLSNERFPEESPASVTSCEVYRQAGEDLWERHGAERGVWSKKMLIALERGVKGGKWFSLIDKVASDRTLSLAWEKVKSNAGGCGVDGITIRRFEKTAQERLLAVKERLKEGRYYPKAVKRVRIPKAGSKETRPLGIPTVEDRVVQQAIRLVAEPIFENGFAEHSYGFRPGRSCHDALRRVHGQLTEGYNHVVDIDIEGYFDNIDQKLLMELVEEKIADGQILSLMESFLKSGVLEDGEWQESNSGTPQGGVISPMLSNLYLDELDHLMEGLGYKMTRYADDIVIECKESKEAEEALQVVKSWMDKVHLRLHPQKTRIVDMTEVGAYFDFLGYRFKRSRKGKVLKLVRPKSLAKIKEQVRKHTRRTNAYSMRVIIAKINPSLRGWFNYYKQAYRTVHQNLDRWIRMRLRSICRIRLGKKGRGRGSDHQKWPNRYFAELGLYSLEEAKLEAISLRNGVKH